MKIKKYNQINENNIDKEDPNYYYKRTAKEYVSDYIKSVDYANILYWIANVSPFEEYKKLLNNNLKNTITLAENKGLKNLKEFLIESDKLEKMYDKLEKMKKKVENLNFKASNESLYSFQEDLIKKDFKTFYKLFLEETENIMKSENIEIGENILEDVHPDIIKKYKNEILEKYKLIKNLIKYNL